MLSIILSLLLLVLAMVSASLRPIYGVKSLKELKRRASKGDQVAHGIYQVARHGLTADVVLAMVSVGAASVAFVLLSRSLSPVLAAGAVVIGVLAVFVVVPSRKTKLAERFALKLSPNLSKILVKIRPATNAVARVVRRNRPITVHTGLYEKEDLIELLQSQKVATHNRIDETELDLAAHALSFGDKLVGDHMVPRRAVHFVHAEDPVGPVLLTELHDSGFSRFPVKTDEDNKIVGTLYLKDLVEKRVSGIVSNVMSPDVFYVRQDAPLEHVLAAFLKTKHHLFMVVNEFEEIVGIITIEDVLEQVLGRKIVDEFDRFDDMRAVARKDASLAEVVHEDEEVEA